MKAQFHVSPHAYGDVHTETIMAKLTLALAIVFVFACGYYGLTYGLRYVLQAILLLAIGLLAGFVGEAFVAWLRKRDIKETYLSSYNWVTSLILVLILPISTTPYAMTISSLAATLLGRAVFGGFGHTIFNPAGVGRTIFMASFTGVSTDVITSATPTTIMANTNHWLAGTDLGKLWLGNYPGAIGETSTILILLLGAWLIYEHVIDWRVPVAYLGTLALMAIVTVFFVDLPTVSGLPPIIWYPLMHMAIGGAAFGAVFMLTDPVTNPVSPAGRVIFAVGAGILTYVIRLAGNLPEGCVYSILLMNMLTPLLDQSLDGLQMQVVKKARKILLVLGIVALGLSVYCAGQIQNDVKTAEVAK